MAPDIALNGRSFAQIIDLLCLGNKSPPSCSVRVHIHYSLDFSPSIDNPDLHGGLQDNFQTVLWVIFYYALDLDFFAFEAFRRKLLFFE